MGSDTRPSRRVKDDENSNSKGKQSGDKGLSAASGSAATSDSSGLRRSSRETLAKKAAAPASPSLSVRKSGRLVKKSPKTPPPAQRKSERVKNKCTPSPLRKSDRGKATLSNSSASKKSPDQNSGSSSMKQKKSKKEKSVKELTSEIEEADRSERCDSDLKKKRLDGRSYKAIFKKQLNKVKASGLDNGEKHEREDKFSQGDSSNCRGECDELDECTERTLGELGDDDGTTENADDELEIIPENCSEAEKVKELELVDCPFSGRIPEDGRGLKSGQDVISSNRKRIRLDGDSDALVTSASKKVHTAIDDATSLTKDRGENEVSTATITGLAEKCDNHLQQKESPRDLGTGGEQYTCFTCKLGGKLLCCDGRECKRSYHLSCLDPPMDDVPPGVWYCLGCVKKKLESGVHSVSEGVESIWNVREVDVLDVDGLRKERDFFVKYKGLAHIHNRWVSENKLLLDAPSLVAKFNRKSQVTRWKKEWTLPHRLLQKRLLMSPKQRDQYLTEHAGEKLDTQYEWLVKWRGLDYEHVTWELDNLLFSLLDGQGLMKDYENRCIRMKGASSSPKADKILESKNCSVKLLQVQSGISSPSDNSFSDYINKLHDFWRAGQNAVVIDEQERIMKSISLIKSFQSNACRPFLIISTSASLHLWDDEFLRLAPQVNVVVYNGNKDLRRSIRKVEFYGEGGCLILQVLITTLEIVVEDLDDLKSIEWELIIIDESQRTRIFPHSAQIKLLSTERRLLLVSGQLKESTSDYINLLSLLEYNSEVPNSESLATSSSNNIGKLKEKFSKCIVHRSKSESSRFREYWVPVQISNVQLEQYCATLISKSALLCSPQKNYLSGDLQDLLVSSRKCCDHPYLVDRNIAVMLHEGLQEVEYLDVDIKASGKLHLLDMLLSEIKKRGSRVLILFQDKDFGRNTIGDFLDDFLRQRFGPDSFERIVSCLHHGKKQAAVDGFNNKESGRFVLLIETRACLSSIKLSSVDTVIIFGSDWNPVNDVRALQKLTLDSQAEQITVFRLYSSFTLEEKVLILAKQGNNNIQNLAWSASHMLLMWGASHQFWTLDKFHSGCVMASEADILLKGSSLEDVTQDMLQIIFSNGKNTEPTSSSIISSVQQIGGLYRIESSLPGELQSEIDEGQPSIFWTKLLEGKHPEWKYICGSSQRNRKRVPHFQIEGAIGESVRKRRKVVPSPELGSVGKTISRGKEGAFGSPASINDRTSANCTSTSRKYNFESEERRKLRDAQKSLHLSLKPEILKLCKILKFSDTAEAMVEEFLQYVTNNHHVSTESTTISQAFQISLCWTVASMLKQKINHKESVALAIQHLNFNCSKEEADFEYSKLRCLKRLFLYRTGKLKVADSPRAPILSISDSLEDYMNGIQSPSSNEQRLISMSGMALETKLVQNDVSRSIKGIQKKFHNKLNKLTQKQQEEKNELVRSFEVDKARIEEKKKMEIVVIRSCLENNTSMRVDKLKSVDISFAKEFEELEHQMNTRLKKLEAEHLAVRIKIQDRKTQCIDSVKSWVALDELLGNSSSSEPDDNVEEVTLRFPQTNSSNDGANNIAHVNMNPPSSEEQIYNGLTVNVSEKEVQLGVPETTGSSEAQLGVPEAIGSGDGLENLVSGDGPLSEEQIPDTTAVSVPINEMQPRVPENASSGGGDTVASVTQMSLAEQIPDTATLNVPGGETTVVPEASCDAVEVGQTSEENDETRTVAPNIIAGMNQEDIVDNAVDQNSPIQELSRGNLSSVHPAIAMIDGDPVSANQAREDECTLPSISCRMQLGDVPSRDEQSATEEVVRSVSQPVETAPSNQSDHEANVSEPAAQVHLSPPSNSPPSSFNAADAPFVGEVANLPSSECCNFNPATELVANPPPLMLNQSVSQPSTSLNQPIGIPIGASGMHFPNLRSSVVSDFNNRPAQALPAMPRLPASQHQDSLEKELERLSKDFDQTRKGFEDKKLHLKAECDKEIAQILLKYELKQQEADAEFFTKKKEFDDIKNKVNMNRILAEAFRFKCMEFRSSGRSGTQQDINASYMQQQIQLSMQQNALRPLLVASSSAASTAAASLQTLAPELQTTVPAPVISPHSTPPPVQGASAPSALFPSATARPPQISSLSYSNGNLQGSAEIRSCPPHLRSSATATSLPPRPQRMSTPPPTNAPAAQSNALPCLTPRLPSSTNQSGSCDATLPPETSRGLPALPNILSALELLRNVDRPPAASPSLAGWLPNTGQLNTTDFTASSASVNPVGTSAPTEVVYLSDDD
ncbi:helicase protein MOM1 isoform X1 [Morus notabilis]|uniref:helicase protein MOM1 isoform X1 n=1 Tax=Morus notabilis TaxID=981085 RepID=UPI000CED45C3|nr:helicase protein MOM1 isoform X1 [Morus notabilis]